MSYKDFRNCKRCGSRYTAHSSSAKYCTSCRKASHGVINSTRLLNFALAELGITKDQLIERLKSKNKGDFEQCQNPKDGALISGESPDLIKPKL